MVTGCYSVLHHYISPYRLDLCIFLVGEGKNALGIISVTSKKDRRFANLDSLLNRLSNSAWLTFLFQSARKETQNENKDSVVVHGDPARNLRLDLRHMRAICELYLTQTGQESFGRVIRNIP